MQYPHWSGRRDKSGKPICIFDSRHLDDVVIQRYNEDRNVSRGSAAVSSAMEQAIVFHDYLTRFVFPVCSAMRDRKQPGTAISSAVYIADVSGMTLKQAWNLRMYIQDFGVLLSTCFPEVIDRIYVRTHYIPWLSRKEASNCLIRPANVASSGRQCTLVLWRDMELRPQAD